MTSFGSFKEAIDANDIDACRALIVQGVHVNALSEVSSGTPLHWAAECGKEAFCRLFIDHGADLSAVDGWRSTALHNAAYGDKNGQICRMLVEAGADIEARDHEDRQPLHVLAGWRDNAEVARVMVELSADESAVASSYDSNNVQLDQTPISMAREAGNVAVLQVLCEASAAKRHQCHLPLHCAASDGNPEVVRLLIDKYGHDVHRISDHDESVLDCAKDDATFLAILEAGGDPHRMRAEPGEGYLTAFQRAVKAGFRQSVRYCLAQGNVDLSQKTLAGESLSELAEQCGDREIRALVLSAISEAVIAEALQVEEGVSISPSQRSAGMSML